MPGLNGLSELEEPAQRIRNPLMKAVKSTNHRRNPSMNVKAGNSAISNSLDRLQSKWD